MDRRGGFDLKLYSLFMQLLLREGYHITSQNMYMGRKSLSLFFLSLAEHQMHFPSNSSRLAAVVYFTVSQGRQGQASILICEPRNGPHTRNEYDPPLASTVHK